MKFFDRNKFTELDPNMKSKDPLEFEDEKYTERLVSVQKKTGLQDAVTTMEKSTNRILIMKHNFNFIGGSMGSVVGEKIGNIEYRKTKTPLIIISKSGLE